MIHYLVYLSSATHLFSNNELTDILTVSRTNNSNLNITGILLYHDGNIIQVLEGEKQMVQELYKKIAKDERHGNVIEMVKGESMERNFAEWSMGFKTLSPGEWSEYEGYIQLQPSSLYSLIKDKNARIEKTLKSFVTNSIR